MVNVRSSVAEAALLIVVFSFSCVVSVVQLKFLTLHEYGCS